MDMKDSKVYFNPVTQHNTSNMTPITCYVMTRGLLICCLLALTGCVHALHPQNARSEQTLRIQASSSERYTVRVDGGQNYPVAQDGRATFEVPPLPRGCAVYLFGLVKVSDSRPEDVRAIHVLRGTQVVRKLSLNQLVRLPVDTRGTHLLTLE
jgi:hypothetical protein